MSTDFSARFSRREFLELGVYSSLLALPRWGFFNLPFGLEPRTIPGNILGASAKTGHLLRGNPAPPVAGFQEVETVIIGGGIAGLSAAWWLDRNRYDRYVLLELEKDVGGNSLSGQNHIGAARADRVG